MKCKRGLLKLSLQFVAFNLIGMVFFACGDAPESPSVTEVGRHSPITILNVSYDPTRELYKEINAAFSAYWKEKTGQVVTVQQSHGGSGSQSRSVIGGLNADVVSLALAFDVDAIVEHGALIASDWQSRLANNSAPYTSTLAFLVRKGNPKKITDWGDLCRKDVEVITPNPKTSGVARWNYLALWGYALRKELGENFVSLLHDANSEKAVSAAQAKAKEFVSAVFQRVPVLDQGARGATNTFVQRRIGDVLINWENEILLGGRELDEAGLEIVIPPVSMLAEPVVALVDRNVDRNGTRTVAEAYLQFLYSEIGQDIVGKHYYRPSVSMAAKEKYRNRFPQVELFTINDVFGGWKNANAVHFADGGTFDQIFTPKK